MDNFETKETTHPAYGMAVFKRITGNPGHFFGSSVECEHFIELEINPGAEVEHGDYFHTYTASGEPPYINVRFTPAQFAELLTSMNIGYGVPCTIHRINNKKVEDIPDEINVNELDRQKQNYASSVKEYKDNLKKQQERVDELLNQPRLNKDERKELKDILSKGISLINNTIPFYMKQFNEATDNIVKDAKAEIDATVQHCIMDAGIKALGVDFKQNQIESK